jgi:hypothetical protein
VTKAVKYAIIACTVAVYAWLLWMVQATLRGYLSDHGDMRDVLLITIIMPAVTAISGMIGGFRVYRGIRIGSPGVSAYAWACLAALIATIPYLLILSFVYSLVILLAFVVCIPVVLVIIFVGCVVAPALVGRRKGP